MRTLSRLMAVLAVTVASTSFSRGDTVLRMGAVAPDNSGWTRELKAFARDIETKTEGHVRLKWYWGAIAGDEMQVLDRIKRDQLDGEAGSESCDRVAPSLRVARVLGLFQDRDEASYVMSRLRGTLEAEFRQHGFLGYGSVMGIDILFTRRPVRNLAELRKTRAWLWSLDELMIEQLKSLGVPIVPTPVTEAMKAYDDGLVDAFSAIPMAALAFQWSARANYFTDLHMGFLPGCLLIANRAFDALSLDEQQAIRDAAAKLLVRFDDLERSQDQRLLNGLFAKQGLRPMPPSALFRAEFFAAAEEARAKISPLLVPPALLQKVGSWLADYRAQHH